MRFPNYSGKYDKKTNVTGVQIHALGCFLFFLWPQLNSLPYTFVLKFEHVNFVNALCYFFIIWFNQLYDSKSYMRTTAEYF